MDNIAQSEDELIEDFAGIIGKIIVARKACDDYLESGTASTFRGDVVVETDAKIAALSREADVIIAMIDDIAENKGFVNRMKKMYKELME